MLKAEIDNSIIVRAVDRIDIRILMKITIALTGLIVNTRTVKVRQYLNNKVLRFIKLDV